MMKMLMIIMKCLKLEILLTMCLMLSTECLGFTNAARKCCCRNRSYRNAIHGRLGRRRMFVHRVLDGHTDAIDDIDSDLDLPVIVQNFNRLSVEAVKSILKVVYEGKPYSYFAALETIARVPYFSYTSVLHLYETLNWLRRKEYIQIHFAESWNELHHLLIMEELGGNKAFADRFVAQHIAFFYYWIVVALYIISPAVAYDLNKHAENHAFDTYREYVQSNEAELKLLPAPRVAVEYYQSGDLHMFDAFQYHMSFPSRLMTDSAGEERPIRRPTVETLYDVFCNIRDDEAEHARTMKILQRDVCLRSRGRIDTED